MINRCVLCMNDGESVDHIILHFLYSKKVWDDLFKLINVDWVFPPTIQLFFSSWKAPSKNTLIGKLWDFIMPYVGWGIWKERNDRIFRDVESNSTQVFHKIKTLLIQNINNLALEQQFCNEWETSVLHNQNLKNVTNRDQGPNPRDLARWDCPPDNWYNINFDGASKGNPRKVGCGTVIRNSNGDNMGSLAIPIGFETNHVIEASTALHGLLYANKMNMKKIWLEGDSLNIINCLNKKTTPSWKISNIIYEAIQIINSFDMCVISHNFREANGLADLAANLACRNDHSFIWDTHDPLPLEAQLLFNHDKWRSSQKAF